MSRARAFYTALFGWTSEAMAFPDFVYTTFKLDDAYVAGMMAITPQMRAMPPHWATYFTVADADATGRLAGELGGTICVPAQDVPGVGRFVGITSPQGVTFFAMQYVT